MHSITVYCSSSSSITVYCNSLFLHQAYKYCTLARRARRLSVGRRETHLEHGEHSRCQAQRGETDCSVSYGEIRSVRDGAVQVLEYAVPGVGDETNQRVRMCVWLKTAYTV